MSSELGNMPCLGLKQQGQGLLARRSPRSADILTLLGRDFCVVMSISIVE